VQTKTIIFYKILHICKFFITFVPDFGIIMEKITKAQVKLVKSLQQKKFRDELDLFIAEGEKCVSELAKSFELEYRIQSTEYRPDQSVLCQAQPVRILSATRSEIEQMSGLRTPQGIVGVFKKRPIGDWKLEIGDLILALDGIQDPGNLGTIIRTCDWFGVHDIVCSLDTADCYNPKVVQATMGALARVRVRYVNLPEWLEELKIQNYELKIFGTLLDGKDMYTVIPESRDTGIIVMGNEGNGISQEVRKLITDPIRIPSYPKNAETSESLNVSIATAIVLAEFRRNR
jgi:TrmH family RNA methyltransferase